VSTATTSQAVVQSIVDEHLCDPAVGQARMFGSSSLNVGGKVFAILWKDGLVLKLPRVRVEELLASPAAQLFDPGHGRTSKEWVWVSPEARAFWAELAREAKVFVSSLKPKGH